MAFLTAKNLQIVIRTISHDNITVSNGSGSVRPGRSKRPTPLDPFADIPRDTTSAYAFYNFYLGEAEGPANPLDIAREQMSSLLRSGALERLQWVFYVTIGSNNKTKEAQLLIPKGRALTHLRKATELETLSWLWRFCRARPTAKVLYFHPKGAYHPGEFNTRFRRNLNCYVLNPACLNALDDYDVCGMRASPFPHLHLPGNMWWARCTHIARLVDPYILERNKTFRDRLLQVQTGAGVPTSCRESQLGIGRYFAETWVGTALEFHVADCLRHDVEMNTPFTYGRGVPAMNETSCPKLGERCGNATMLVIPKAFENGVRFHRKHNSNCSSDEWVKGRAKIMYGGSPELALRWRNLWMQTTKVA